MKKKFNFLAFKLDKLISTVQARRHCFQELHPGTYCYNRKSLENKDLESSSSENFKENKRLVCDTYQLKILLSAIEVDNRTIKKP